MNAYFVGKAISEEISTTQQFILRRNLTKHYQVMVDNTFNLFEVNSYQIIRTKYITVQDIKKMKHSEIFFKINFAINF
jgi:hypothetical protein